MKKAGNTRKANGVKPSRNTAPKIEAIDLFCGAGGLSYGLKKAGIKVKVGIDVDPACEFAYTKNIKAKFLKSDVAKLTADQLAGYFSPSAIRLLAGCAPCQPFSTLANGRDTSEDEKWGLLGQFARLVRELQPELVTMENVPRVTNHEPYKKFIKALEGLGYHIDAQRVRCADFGIPQVRRRFVLIASRIGPISFPDYEKVTVTVREAIGHLTHLKAGETDDSDRLHKARTLTEINLKRIRASTPGGTWETWPKHLLSPCHTKEGGASFRSVYARMEWDAPSPTITTQAYNFGTGRFGHPEQDRAITLREAAILQSFPADYEFVSEDAPVSMSTIGRLIGNAVPPRLGEVIGKNFINHINK